MRDEKLAEEVIEKGLKVLELLGEPSHPDLRQAAADITAFLEGVENGTVSLPVSRYPGEAAFHRHVPTGNALSTAYSSWNRALRDEWERTPAASAWADRFALWMLAEHRMKKRPNRPGPVGAPHDCAFPHVADGAIELRDDFWNSHASLVWSTIGDIVVPVFLSTLILAVSVLAGALLLPIHPGLTMALGFVPAGLFWWKVGPKVAAWIAGRVQPKIDWSGHTLHLPGRQAPGFAMHLGSAWRLTYGFHKEYDEIHTQRVDRLWFILHTEDGQRYMLFSDGLPWRQLDVSVPDAREPRGPDAPTDRVMIEPNDWVLIFNRLAALDTFRQGRRIGLLDDLGMPEEIKKQYGLA